MLFKIYKKIKEFAGKSNLEPEQLTTDYLIKKYGTNRKYTETYLTHLVANHKNNPLFNLYLESELGCLNRCRELNRYLSAEFNNNALFKGKACLDIGCSSGQSLISFVEMGASKAQGIEIEEGRINMANLNLSECSTDVREKITARLGDIEDAAVVASLGSFDIITCSDVLEHVKNPVDAIGSICRLLNKSKDAFIYIHVWNYLKPDNIISEPHYGIPALALLPYPISEQYYEECKLNNGLSYGVYHWKSFVKYKEIFRSFNMDCRIMGGAIGRKSHDKKMITEEVGKARQILPAFEKYAGSRGISSDMKNKIVNAIEEYVSEIEASADKCLKQKERVLFEDFYLRYCLRTLSFIVTRLP